MGVGISKLKPNGESQIGEVSCRESWRLLDAFGDEVQRLMELHEQQFLAIVEGQPTANRFDILIHEANERKQNAKYAYMNHLELHGCSLEDDEADQS